MTAVIAPTFARRHKVEIADELRSVARQVRAIGRGRSSDPEAVAIAKDSIAHRLVVLARQLEAPPV